MCPLLTELAPRCSRFQSRAATSIEIGNSKGNSDDHTRSTLKSIARAARAMPTSEGIDTWSGTLHIAHQDLSRVASNDTAFEVDIKATPFGLSILAMELRKPAMS